MDDRKPCWKEQHESKREAAAAMHKVLKYNGPRPGGSPSVFKCTRCGFWHWGHKVKVKLRK